MFKLVNKSTSVTYLKNKKQKNTHKKIKRRLADQGPFQLAPSKKLPSFMLSLMPLIKVLVAVLRARTRMR